MRSAANKTTQSRSVSRRSFLMGGATLGASALVASAAGSLVGCSKETGDSGDAAPEAAGIAAEYEVINTDILVIGGGNLGVNAAYSALTEGRTVTILDKGPWRHSGVSGMSWDYFAGRYFAPPITYQGIENGKALQNAIAFSKESDRFVYQVNLGQTLPDRDENGQYLPYLNEIRTQGQFCRRHADDISSMNGFNVEDQFMVTKLLLCGGKCCGAMGIHIPTGKMRVYRANATLMATGGCCWIYGWMTVGAYSINNPDNTADAEMAAFRQGIGIANAEFASYDLMTINPTGLCCAFGAGVGADAQEYEFIYDNNGEPLFDPDDPNVSDRNYFNQYVAKAISVDGRGTEDNGVYLNVGQHKLRYGNERNIPLLEKFGVKLREDRVKIAPEMFEHGGVPAIDENMMTEVPGLFCGRNQPNGSGVDGNYYYGVYMGHTAAKYAESIAEHVEIDWATVEEEYARLHSILQTAGKEGIRPLELRKKIQLAGFQGLGVYRTTEHMEAALAELVRIREEDLPKMVVADSSNIYNTEWKHAIENYNLLDIAEISVRASINREDTRASYMRAEFPERDDENWNCTQVCRLVDGEMTFEKVQYESFDASVLEK